MKTLGLKQTTEKVTKFLLSLVDNKKNLEILYFSLLALSTLTLFLGFQWSIYVIWWLLGFGWSMFFFRKNINLLEHFLLGGIVFTSLFLVFICLFAIIDIPVNIFFFLGFALISLFVFLKFKVFENINLDIKDYDYLALFLFILALLAKVYPYREYFAAPLHDPLSHSMMAKKILDTGLIEYFYSPGLHILSAFGAMMKGFIVSKQVLVLSGFFSAYSGIVAYVFLKNFLKDKRWALITATLFSVGYYPAMLTFNAGKNTLIMAISILFFLMFTMTEYIKGKDWKILLVSALAIASLFLTHYPMAVIGCVFVGIIFILYFKEFKWKGFLIVLGVLFGLAWALRSYKYELLIQDDLVNPDRTSIGYGNGAKTVQEAIGYFFAHFAGNLKQNLKNWNRYPTLLSFLSLPFLLVISIVKKNKKQLLIFLWIIGTLAFMLLLVGLRISMFTIIIESYLVSLMIYVYILIGFFLSLIYKFLVKKLLDGKKWNYIIIGMFISAIFLVSYMFLQQNRGFMSGEVNSVLEDDVVVFEWIEKNTSKEDKVLINAYTLYDIVFSSDAGGYIEIFTGRKISMPFYEYDRKETYENFENYLAVKGNMEDCIYRQKFIDSNYKYYYQGTAQPFSEPLLTEEEIATTTVFTPVFRSGNSILFEIVGCE